jgi:hypothetical protein
VYRVVSECLLAGLRILNGTDGKYWNARKWYSKIKNVYGKEYKFACLHLTEQINQKLKANAIEYGKLKKECWEKRLIMDLIFGAPISINVCKFSNNFFLY